MRTAVRFAPYAAPDAAGQAARAAAPAASIGFAPAAGPPNPDEQPEHATGIAPESAAGGTQNKRPHADETKTPETAADSI